MFPAKRPGRCCALQRKPFLEHLLRGGFLVPSPRALRGLVLQQLESDLFSFSCPRSPKFEFLSEALPGPMSLRALSPKALSVPVQRELTVEKATFSGRATCAPSDRKSPSPGSRNLTPRNCLMTASEVLNGCDIRTTGLSALLAIGDHNGNFARVCSVKCQLLVILVP